MVVTGGLLLDKFSASVCVATGEENGASKLPPVIGLIKLPPVMGLTKFELGLKLLSGESAIVGETSSVAAGADAGADAGEVVAAVVDA